MTEKEEDFLEMVPVSKQVKAALFELLLPDGRVRHPATKIPSPSAKDQPHESAFAGGLMIEENIYSRFLKEHPMAVLREVTEHGSSELLSSLLTTHWFSSEQCLAALSEFPGADLRLRILLLHPEFARSTDALLDAKAHAPESIDSLLTHFQFRAGAAYPPLREAVTKMERISDSDIKSMGSDGLAFYFNPSLSDPPSYKDFQHSLIHCLFMHMIIPKGALITYWDLACDLAAEYIRTELFPAEDKREVQLTVADMVPAGCNPRIPAQIYKGLMEMFEEDLESISNKVMRDDHSYWYRAPGKSEASSPDTDGSRKSGQSGIGQDGSGQNGPGNEETEEEPADPRQERQAELARKLPEQWEQIAEQIGKEGNLILRRGLTPGSREDRLVRHAAGKYDFTRYLHRFSVIREELQLDMDNFDYIPYYYGFQMYGNMPMIEPLEYTESHKVEELVIAIDTSGSCSRDTVSRFLAEIQRILIDRENFFRKMNIHIIQCDAMIQDHAIIHSITEWERYRKDLTIKGRGGTNFQPVFALVENLRAKNQLRDLKGLLYFTDGDGVYPKNKPSYETAFVFTDKKALKYGVPDWVVKLILDPIADEGGQ